MVTVDTATLSPLERAQIAKQALFRANAIRKVAAWRQFVKDEASAHRRLLAGEIERTEWSALWSNAPTMPTESEYRTADLAMDEVHDLPNYADGVGAV